MKRYNNLFNRIVNIDNLELADKKARRGKHNYGIIKHDLKKQEHYKELLTNLLNGTYKTSEYDTFTIYEPKERIIFRLPYYPDRLLHHISVNTENKLLLSLLKETKNPYIKL